MKTFPRYMYSRDPLDILISREEATCKGCVHRIKMLGREGCDKGNKPRRCKFYKEKESAR